MLAHFRFMQQALILAEQAYRIGEWPVGCVIVHNDTIIGQGYNQVEALNDPTAHAEFIACMMAKQVYRHRYLDHCTVYTTLEPCKMCWYLLRTLRVQHIVIGAQCQYKNPYPSITVTDCIYEQEARDLLHRFAQTIRTC